MYKNKRGGRKAGKEHKKGNDEKEIQEGRTDVLSRLKREKMLEIQRTRGEKKRDEWTEEKRGMCRARG